MDAPPGVRWPTRAAIRLRWADRLVELGKFDCVEEVLEAFYCFACGMDPVGLFELQRAHIVARCDGGSDGVDNLHLLCEPCHKASESLDGDAYWSWLTARTAWMTLAEACCRYAPVDMAAQLMATQAPPSRSV